MRVVSEWANIDVSGKVEDGEHFVTMLLLINILDFFVKEVIDRNLTEEYGRSKLVFDWSDD